MAGNKVEETKNNGMITYYSCTTLLFICLSVFCGSFFVNFKDVQCIALDPGPIPGEEGEEGDEVAAEEGETTVDGSVRRALDLSEQISDEERQLRLWDTLRIMSLDQPRQM